MTAPRGVAATQNGGHGDSSTGDQPSEARRSAAATKRRWIASTRSPESLTIEQSSTSARSAPDWAEMTTDGVENF
jgi:hypothetical protein